ncbi:MAG TPA: DUF484 domain-containing protein [Gammaproteobacteria bacterium]|nr:DUF484 domain-containing protein [Gammaproteobacteria bacterium]
MTDDKVIIDEQFEEAVDEYLRLHSDYFERHPGLLTELELSHDAGEGSISLIQRQVQVLRSKVEEYRAQLQELIGVARENENLNQRLYDLTLMLIESHDLESLMDILLDDLREQFDADAVELRLFEGENMEQAVNEGQPASLMFADFLQHGKPKCGALNKEQLEYLFGSLAAETGSAALIPLEHKHTRGILAIGSRDAQRFHPGKDTGFLQRLGGLVSHSLARISIEA